MTDLICPHCGTAVFRKSASGDRLKARTSIVVLHSNGGLEINCGQCRNGVVLPVVAAPAQPLEKAERRFVIRRLLTQG